MDTATILTTINYNDFTPMDMIYIIEELSEVHGTDKVKTTLKSIITLMEKYEREHQFSFTYKPNIRSRAVARARYDEHTFVLNVRLGS